MDCPKCLGRLSKLTVRLNQVYRSEQFKGEGITQELELDQCFVCSGVWFDAGELAKYLAEKVTIVDSPAVDAQLQKKWDKKLGACPRCCLPMVKAAAQNQPKIQVDTCEKCHGIWLDTTEVDLLEGQKKLSLTDNVKAFIQYFMEGNRN